jgi:hypothetical protein
MRIAFCPSIGPFDFECDIDADVEWEDGSPHLVINGVYEHSDRENLLLGDNKLLKDLALEIADLAEDCPELLARAVEQDVFERAA